MAIVQHGPRRLQKLPKSISEIIGFTWNSTDTTGTITIQLKRIFHATFFAAPALNLAAAESFCITGLTQDSEGFWIVPNNGIITVSRTGASVTTGLAMSVRLEGY